MQRGVGQHHSEFVVPRRNPHEFQLLWSDDDRTSHRRQQLFRIGRELNEVVCDV